MADNREKQLKIKQKIYRQAGILALILYLMTTVGILLMNRAQNRIDNQYAESTEKYNVIGELEGNLNEVFFHARGYYAFQEEQELNLLNQNIDELSESIDRFQSLPLTAEEEALGEGLAEFYDIYTQSILPEAIGFVENDDYASLRELARSGANAQVNEFLAFTETYLQERQDERDALYEQAIDLTYQFITGFVILGLISLLTVVYITRKLLNDITHPINDFIYATSGFRQNREWSMKSQYRFKELHMLADSFNELALEVQEKEEELTSQNEELLAQQDELEFSQQKMQEYVVEIEAINKALNDSALLCITDENGMIVSVNDLFCKISQYDEDELIGNTTRILKTDQQNKTFYERLWQTITKGKIWTGKMKNEKKDGSYYWINATIVPFLDSKGIPYRYILIGIDISDNIENELKLEHMLTEMQESNEQIERYSQLNEELTATVDRQEFLDQVLGYIRGAVTFDKGLLISLKEKDYQSVNMSPDLIDRFMAEDGHGEIAARLKSEQLFIIKRQASSSEKGVADTDFNCWDLYISVSGGTDDLDLVLALTRKGEPFEDEELKELSVLTSQLNVAWSRITMYEAVLKERSLNESIVQNVREGLQLVSSEGDLLQANDTLIKLTGAEGLLDQETINEADWIERFTSRSNEPEELKAFYHQSMAPEQKRLSSIRCQIEDGQERQIQIYASPVMTAGEKTGTIFMYRDITKEFEIDRMKSELVSTVSHELRTPLSSVLGFTEMLMMKELKPEKQKRYLETIYKEAKRLTNLINDFLDIQRIESGKQDYEKTEVNMSELIMQVIESFRHKTTHSIYLQDDAYITAIQADPDRMVQVLTNLISNAVKFSPDGGKIAIKLENRRNELAISITDSGIGIPSSELPHMFTKFKRIDNSASKKIGGTGLGLSISKGIIEAHHGTIKLDSVENEGTTVYISLPLSPEYSTLDMGAHMDQHTEIKGTVLIVEDDISFASMLSETLKANGFRVIHYLSSQNIVAIASQQPLIGIVMDLILEDGVSGWHLISEIRENEKTKNLPIIVSSAVDKTAETAGTFNLTDYLVKPYSPNDLSVIVLDLWEKQSGHIN